MKPIQPRMIWTIVVITTAGALVGGWFLGQEFAKGTFLGQHKELVAHIESRDQQIADLKKEAGDLNTLLYDKSAELARKNKELADRDKEIARLRGLETDLAALKAAAADKDLEIARQKIQIAELRDPKTAGNEQEKELARLRGVEEELKAAKAAIEAKDKEIAELKAKLATAPETAPTSAKLAVSFGKWNKLEAVAGAKWKSMGGAAKAMRPAMAEILKSIGAGKPPDPALVKSLQNENAKLVDYYLRIRGKVPTHFAMNGEFAHPVTWVNLASAQLEAAEKPLTEDQVKQLSELGEEYERRWDALQATYTASTLEFRKMYDEMDLKNWFSTSMYDALTAEQRTELWDEDVRGRVQLDLYSPGTMMQMGAMDFVTGETRDALRTALIEKIVQQWGLDRGRVEAQAYLFEDWLNETAAVQEPATATDRNVPKVATVLTCGKAQLKAMDELKKVLGLDDEGAKALRAEKSFWLLRIAKPG